MEKIDRERERLTQTHTHRGTTHTCEKKFINQLEDDSFKIC